MNRARRANIAVPVVLWQIILLLIIHIHFLVGGSSPTALWPFVHPEKGICIPVSLTWVLNTWCSLTNGIWANMKDVMSKQKHESFSLDPKLQPTCSLYMIWERKKKCLIVSYWGLEVMVVEKHMEGYFINQVN